MTIEATETVTTATIVNALTLHDTLHNALLFASDDRTIPALAAVLLTVEDGVLTAVATDRYVLGIATVPLDETDKGDDLTWLLARDDVKALLTVLKAAGKYMPARISVVGDQLVVGTLDAEMRYRRVEAEFPRYKALIPAPSTDGGPDMIGFSAKYLALFAKVKGVERHETVRLGFQSSDNKVVRFNVGANLSGLLMPVRITS
jgi:DNA polymerase-3 subunit beta